VLVLFFSRHILVFLREHYSKPFLTNTYAEFIPSKKIKEEIFIKNKDGSYSGVIELKGYPYFRAEDLEQSKISNLKIRERALNFKDLQENIHIKFMFKRFKEDNGYNNSNFIEITSDTKEVLKETIDRLLGSLHDFKPIALKDSELLSFLFMNCNLIKRSPTFEENIRIDDLCSYSSIQFEDDYGYLTNIDTKKYFKCLSLNFGSEIDTKYFSQLITSNIEFDFIINTKFLDSISAQKILNTDKKNISASNDESKKAGVFGGIFNSSNKKISELSDAQEDLDNEDTNLTLNDTFIIIFADTQEELETSITTLKEIMSRYEIYLNLENYLLNFFFLQRLIGFKLHHTMKFLSPETDVLVYAKKILSNTIAGLVDYIDMPTGLNKCDWGEKPISSFSTNYNNLYNFYTHVSEEKASVGHGVIIAPTGAGKTTFVQYIMKGILESYKDVDVYSFDRNNGISVFTNWVGGRDINFLDLAINPLQVDLSKEDNKEFLHNFLSMIAKPNEAEDKEILNDFINVIAEYPKELRILKELLENDQLPPCKIRENLEIWANGKYAKYINAKEDKFSLDGQMLNFQMDEIIDDEELSAPIIYYIMFKIRQSARATSRGHFIFIDESAKMLKNPYFRKQIDVLLTEHRKLRGCVWLAFQNPSMFLNPIPSGKDAQGNDIFESIKELILNQCQNQILFSSDAIVEETLDNLNINRSIYNELIETQKATQNKHCVLLKRPQENVILNVNLKEKLGSDLRFLSSSVEDVNRMRELMEEHGSTWHEYF
jgi:type IV secretory pathway VirB4 component